MNTGEAFNTHVCYADCGNVYWSLRICPRCQHPEQTIFLKKPNFSELIMCRNCKSNMYYFRCPQKSCEVLFYKDYESYLIGFPVECTNCHFKYRTLACTCGNEIRLHIDTIITEGISKFICPTCRKDVIYTICSKCFKTEYHMETLEIGDNIRCTNCKTRRVFVPCPYCRRSTKGLKFNFRELNQCNYC